MKRKLTLAGSIIAIVSLAASFVAACLMAYILLPFLALGRESADPETIVGLVTIAVITLVPCVFYLVPIILNIVNAIGWNKSIESFARRKKLYITTIVFNFLALIVAVACSIQVAELLAIYMGTGVISIIGNILLIVDLAKEGKRVRALREQDAAIKANEIEE